MEKKKRVGVSLTNPKTLENLAFCQRAYSELRNDVTPQAPVIIGVALSALSQLYTKQLTKKVEVKSESEAY
jgi:hypothetical protein